MKKIYLLLICFFTINLAFAQKEPGPNFRDADPKFFKLGGKPIPNSKCFKLTDFKKKLEITSGKADSIDYADFYVVRGKKAIGNLKVNSQQEFSELDLYTWLTTGKNPEQETPADNSVPVQSAPKKFKLKPADRLSLELMYYKDGERKSIIKNFTPFCE